jgi:TetR/AcrR family transcriptional repressor of nem operon
MRYSSEHKRRTHARILDAAARVFRQRGYSGAGVDTVMEEAGLTPGGFYAHFASKEALLVETLQHALRTAGEHWAQLVGDQKGMEWVQTFVRRYLSRTHCNAVPEGCPVPALISEISRSSPAAKQTFEVLLHEIVSFFEKRIPEEEEQTPADRAIAILALCFGGLALARAVDSPSFANQILRACREFAVPESK